MSSSFSQWLSMYTRASTTSLRLWGGMEVAMPTAMPVAPLTSRLGMADGSTLGSVSVSSKFGPKSTVFLLRSDRMSRAGAVRRASVYRMAAGGSPSTEPKLPCPSTSIVRIEKSCAMRAMASYTAASPCGWYLPSTSPTMRADFLYAEPARIPMSYMAYRMRRCTGFSPSRASGSARATMTDMA